MDRINRSCTRVRRIFAMLRVTLGSSLWLPGALNAADETNELIRLVTEFLMPQVRQAGEEVVITPLISSARFPTCENPEPFLPVTMPRRWGRVSVGVRCGTDIRSVRYLQLQISVTTRYYVATAAIRRDTALTPSLFEARRGDMSQLPPNTIFDIGQTNGQLTRQRLSAGSILQSQHLYRRPLVHASQQVDIESLGRGFRISGSGQALEAGALGERIMIRTTPRTVMKAVVTGEGRVSPAP